MFGKILKTCWEPVSTELITPPLLPMEKQNKKQTHIYDTKDAV